MTSIGSYAPTLQQRNLTEGFRATQRSRTTYQARESADISLVTADGDRVTISADSSLRAKVKTYDYLGRVDGQSVALHREQVNIAAQSSVEIFVEGSLDEEELADIQELLDSLAAARDEFFSGDSAAGLSELAGLDELDSIASFEAKLTYSERLTSRTRTKIAATEQTATDSVAAAGDEPTAVANSANHLLIDQLTKVAEFLESQGSLSKLPKRSDQLLTKLAHREPLDDRQAKLLKHLERRLSH